MVDRSPDRTYGGSNATSKGVPAKSQPNTAPLGQSHKVVTPDFSNVNVAGPVQPSETTVQSEDLQE
jgi:hypothetical protein